MYLLQGKLYNKCYEYIENKDMFQCKSVQNNFAEAINIDFLRVFSCLLII